MVSTAVLTSYLKGHNSHPCISVEA